MNTSLQITQVNLNTLAPAAALLASFMVEEGFTTPPERITHNLHQMIEHPSTAAFLAWQNDTAIGVATVRYSPSIEHGLYAELEDLYVLPEGRGKGVAKALVAHVGDWCMAQGCSRVEVCVTPEGQAAHDLMGFYDKLGFADTGRDMLYKSLS